MYGGSALLYEDIATNAWYRFSWPLCCCHALDLHPVTLWGCELLLGSHIQHVPDYNSMTGQDLNILTGKPAQNSIRTQMLHITWSAFDVGYGLLRSWSGSWSGWLPGSYRWLAEEMGNHEHKRIYSVIATTLFTILGIVLREFMITTGLRWVNPWFHNHGRSWAQLGPLLRTDSFGLKPTCSHVAARTWITYFTDVPAEYIIINMPGHVLSVRWEHSQQAARIYAHMFVSPRSNDAHAVAVLSSVNQWLRYEHVKLSFAVLHGSFKRSNCTRAVRNNSSTKPSTC